MQIRSVFLLFFTLFSSLGISIQAAPIKHIIFDMGFVLVEPNTMKKAGQLGIGNCLGYLCSGGNKKDIKLRAYEVLVHAGGPQLGQPETWLYDHENTLLPRLFADWQLGLVTAQEIRDYVQDSLETLQELDFFMNKPEYNCVKNLLLEGIFNPEGLAEGMKPSKPGCKLLERLSKEINQDGSQRYEFYILSNWDPESFSILYEQTKMQKKIFDYIKPEHIMISGEEQMAKPDPAFFKKLCSRHNLNPEECLFIDDQAENIKTAQSLGFSTVRWDKDEASDIIEELEELEILSEK